MAPTGSRFIIDSGDLEWDRTARGDRGAAAVQAVENQRLLDPNTLQEDLARARSRYDRTSRRLAALDPRSKAARRLEAQLGTLTATIQSLAERLERFGIA